MISRINIGISISEWELLHQNEDNMDALVALSGIKKEDIQKLSKKGLDVAYAHIEELRKSEYGELVEKLNINGVQYGFVNDWDSFSMGEWIDMENYCKDVSKNAKNILSLLYREIVREEGKRYWIKDSRIVLNNSILVFKKKLSTPPNTVAGISLNFSGSSLAV